MTDQQITNNKPRYEFIDWLRGVSILLMIIYHFCYDLDFFGYINTAFGKGYWIPFRYVIVIGFLTMVGASLYIVHRDAVRWKSLRKRTVQMVVACLIVSLSGLAVAPEKITVFGILHFILLATFLALPLVNKPLTALIVGIIIFVLGHVVQHSFFDPLWLHWLGMVETKRPALDYVPVFPWLGVVLMGVWLGHWLLNTRSGQHLVSLSPLAAVNEKLTRADKGLIKMGQHSLVIYLVHQPLMFAVFYAIDMI